MRKIGFAGAIIILGLGSVTTAAGQAAFEPDHVTVQHILVAFQGSIPGSQLTRTMEEAEKLARELFARARMGEDFDALVKEYTNDQYPGVYAMANNGVAADEAAKEAPRNRMVKAFGDVSFGLRIGEIGLAVYDATSCKYGWHIIKRLK